MSGKTSITAEVLKIKSVRHGVRVKFGNITLGKGLARYKNTFSTTYPENPGWDEGDEIELTAKQAKSGRK